MILVCTESEQGGRKDRQRNEPVGSCATCDARCTGPSALRARKLKHGGSRQNFLTHTKVHCYE